MFLDNKIFGITELEAILLTMTWGFEGNELNTRNWLKNGSLDGTKDKETQEFTDRAILGLISKLYTRYENIEVMGRGKNRKYILLDLRVTPIERKMNYKGTEITDDEQMMKEIIFNQLVSNPLPKGNEKNGRSNNSWANHFGIFDSDRTKKTEDFLIETLVEQFGEETVYFKPKHIINGFNQAIYDLRVTAVEKAFERLQKENRIKVTMFHIAVKQKENVKTKHDVEFVVISQQEYDRIEQHKEMIINAMGSSIKEYRQNYIKREKTLKMRLVFSAVEEMLWNDYGVKRIYKSYSIEVLDSKTKKDTTYYSFEQFLFNRLKKLTRDRSTTVKYTNSTFYWHRFYLLNTYTILEVLEKEHGIDFELFQLEKELYSDKLELFKSEFYSNLADKRAKDVKPTFAEIIAEEFDKREIEETDQIEMEGERSEESGIREARSLQFDSTFNIKPEEFRVKWDNSLLEIHSEEELEMMREEQLLENSQLELCS
ncbi:hypothetical protein MKX53_15430 [Psychrobacillus sp. FSL K6-4615]|uniref:hypothetical protein n=1 Tax=Psychrobacillus sp. FSL K6-4615 TaxID=2921551 RepID=UPI0030F5978A